MLLTLLFSAIVFGQYPLRKGGVQLNTGVGLSGWGVPVYAGFDYGVHKDISVGGEISFRSYNEKGSSKDYNHSIIEILACGNYHFNSIMKIPNDFDFYMGLSLGYWIWSSPAGYGGAKVSGIGLGAQIGGRYYFNKNLGINLEINGSSASGAKFGISYLL